MAKLGDLKKDESPTVTNLGRLIARMALDETLHRRYLGDAASVIAEAGLDAREAKALEDGDWTSILSLLGPKTRPIPGSFPEPDKGGG